LAQNTKIWANVPNVHKNDPNGRDVYQHFPFKDPVNYTQIGIFECKYTIWQPRFKTGGSCSKTATSEFET
jgi:hypothetical protein